MRQVHSKQESKVEDINRKCNCGGIGCLETVVSANGIKNTYAKKMNLNI